MKELKKLIGDMWDEVNGAKHYAHKAVECKEHDPTHAGKYAEMANQELSHVDNLHRMAMDHMATHPEHEMMHIIWEWEWDRILDAMAEVKGMLGMAR